MKKQRISQLGFPFLILTPQAWKNNREKKSCHGKSSSEIFARILCTCYVEIVCLVWTYKRCMPSMTSFRSCVVQVLCGLLGCVNNKGSSLFWVPCAGCLEFYGVQDPSDALEVSCLSKLYFSGVQVGKSCKLWWFIGALAIIIREIRIRAFVVCTG